jgi:hypothetical protein
MNPKESKHRVRRLDDSGRWEAQIDWPAGCAASEPGYGGASRRPIPDELRQVVAETLAQLGALFRAAESGSPAAPPAPRARR